MILLKPKNHFFSVSFFLEKGLGMVLARVTGNAQVKNCRGNILLLTLLPLARRVISDWHRFIQNLGLKRRCRRMLQFGIDSEGMAETFSDFVNSGGPVVVRCCHVIFIQQVTDAGASWLMFD